MTSLFGVYVSRSSQDDHARFTAMEPFLRWTLAPGLSGGQTPAVGDIAVLASTSHNARVPPGG